MYMCMLHVHVYGLSALMVSQCSSPGPVYLRVIYVTALRPGATFLFNP